MQFFNLVKLIDRLEKGLKNITNVETPAADANYLPFGWYGDL